MLHALVLRLFGGFCGPCAQCEVGGSLLCCTQCIIVCMHTCLRCKQDLSLYNIGRKAVVLEVLVHLSLLKARLKYKA